MLPLHASNKYRYMKRVYFILCVAVLFAACKKEDKSAKLLEDFQALNDHVSEQLKQTESPAQADSIIEAYVNEAFAMQQAAPGSEASYVILEDIYYMLSLPQKEQAFVILDPDSIEARGMQRYLEAFQAEQRTMAGSPFTDFTAFSKDGAAVQLSSLVGQKDFLLVDFWASWCGPCRRSMPGLKELLAAHGDRLSIVGISVDDSEESWLQAVEALEITWLQLRDVNDEGSRAYGITAIPHTVLINRDGIILAHNPEHEEVAELIK